MRLIHIFYVIAFTASAIQLFGTVGILIAIGISAGWAYVFFAGDGIAQRSRLGRLMIAAILLFLLGLLLLPAVQTSREASRRMQCRNNVKQLSLALYNYESKYGSFPPAITRDAQGESMHSWRVLLLPFLEQQSLYDAYAMDEPWDGPGNSQLLEQMPRVYKCYSNASPEFETGYCVVVGERTCFPPDGSRRLRDITDDASKTVAIVESKHTVPWMAPRDPTLEQFKQEATSWGPSNFPPHFHSDTFTHYYSPGSLGMADGSSSYFASQQDGALWDKLLQIDDGTPTDLEASDSLGFSNGSFSRIRVEGYLALAVFLFLAFLPAFWLHK